MKSKTVEFLNSLLTETSNYRLHVLESLERVFGCKHSIFWQIDDFGNFTDPVYFNVEDDFMDAYLSWFYQEDVLNPHKVKSRITCKDVLTTEDVIPLDDYENTVYYRELMRQYNYYHGAVIYLKKNNNLIGGIGLGMREGYTPNAKEIKRLEVVSKHISSTFSAKQLLDNTKYQKLILETSFNQLPIGVVFFDEFFDILYSNQVAQDIFLEVAPNTEMKEYLGRILTGNFASWRSGMVKTFFTENLGQMLFHIVPGHVKDITLYTLYLVPQNVLLKNSIHYDANPCNLSERELEIVELVMKGYSNKDVANELFISISTVKTHLQNIFKKVGVSNRTSLCRKLRMEPRVELFKQTSVAELSGGIVN